MNTEVGNDILITYDFDEVVGGQLKMEISHFIHEIIEIKSFDGKAG